MSMTSRETLEKELERLSVKPGVLGVTQFIDTDTGKTTPLAYVTKEGVTAIIAAVDAHVERVIGPDEDYRKLKPCKLCGGAYQYRCSCADAVNTRLTEQRQRAGQEVKQ